VSKSSDLREAVAELHHYFSDQLAPMMVADSMGLLLEHPASLLAPEIAAWVAKQQTQNPGVATADLLYHAAKKVALMGEFDLVSHEALRRYVTDLAGELLGYCPFEDQEALAHNLALLGQLETLSDGGPSSALQLIYRIGGSADAGPSGAGAGGGGTSGGGGGSGPRTDLGMPRSETTGGYHSKPTGGYTGPAAGRPGPAVAGPRPSGPVLQRPGQTAPSTLSVASGGADTAPITGSMPMPPARSGHTFGTDLSRGLKRLSMLLDRLRPQAALSVPPEQKVEVASHFVSTAAVQSQTDEELRRHLEPLRQFGIEPAMDKIFRALAATLPGWGTVAVGGKEAAPPLIGAQLNAMRQIVSLVGDPAEAGRRFRELVYAAVEQFNDGHLGRAVTMLELAERLVTEGRVQTVFVEPMRKEHERLSPEKLKKYVDRGDSRAALRHVLSFFDALTPEGLLSELNGEQRRERRHELLGMLETHGTSARALAREWLRQSVENPDADVDPYLEMNSCTCCA
jgi:hypothetical protein